MGKLTSLERRLCEASRGWLFAFCVMLGAEPESLLDCSNESLREWVRGKLVKT